MAAQSTVAVAAPSVKTKTSALAKNADKVMAMQTITSDILKAFKFLEAAPDALYWLMATWGAESRWNLWFNHNGVSTSLHYTPSLPQRESTAGLTNVSKTGTLIGNGYQFSPVIQNLWNDPATTIATKNNIKEGWYAHGISGCMGTYHVKGCYNNLGEWRRYPEAVGVINTLGLEVNPGQSIFQTLFNVDNQTCWLKSIASGMIIFNYKYRWALEHGYKNRPTAAMQYAVGAFVGRVGSADGNGTTPEARIKQLNSRGGEVVAMLDYLKTVRTGKEVPLTPTLVDLNDKSAVASTTGGTTTVASTGPVPATTDRNNNGASQKTAGCIV